VWWQETIHPYNMIFMKMDIFLMAIDVDSLVEDNMRVPMA
jgi:hypothetical protein